MLLHRNKAFLAVLVLTLAALLSPSGFAQTFRGQLTGVVTDIQGGVVANAAIKLTNPATDISIDGKSNGVGEFTFPELVPGTYSVKVTVPGFETAKIDDINVAVSTIATVKVVLAVGSENTVVDVQANGVQVDTASSSLVSVVGTQQVADMPMNGRDFTKMIPFTAGVVGSGYVNGNSHINYQVDGTDNVDSWLGIVASNQGGIENIPGGLIPVEAIDQFSVQSNAQADQGRNAGANQNMVLKSGTNQIHGDLFYFNRNEFFAAISPVAAVGSRKAPIRNNQFGFTLGGPIWKDHTFLFLAGEIQLASAGNSTVTTVINPGWITAAQQFNVAYGLSPLQNPVTAAIYSPSGVSNGTTLFPDVSPTTGAVVNNWFAGAPDEYNSYNGVIKLDHHFSEKESLSLRYLGTTGKQTAVTSDYYPEYFQTAPMHIHNASVIQTTIFSARLLNQVTLGMNYFLQTFNDADQNYYPGKNDGLNVGAAGIIAAGAPTISISGFQSTGATQPSGRTDVTGQISDSLRWTLGKHSMTFGGEFRHTNVDSIGLSSSRGSFTFDGTGGPWSSTSVGYTPQMAPLCIATDPLLAASANPTGYTATQYSQCEAIVAYSIGGAADVTGTLKAGSTAAQARGQTPLSNIISAADFFLGQTSHLPTSASLRVGVGTRIYLLNQEDFWASDSFQVTRQLTVNYGVRWSIPGVVHDAQNDLTSWTPKGFISPIYNNYYKAIAPRMGFSYSPFPSGRTALRGAWGLIYDVPSMSTMATGVAGNPAGPDPSYVATTPSFNFKYGINPFATATAPATLPGSGINPNYRIAYQENYSLGIEQQLSKSSLLSIGYVGSEGRRLPVTYDLNQATSYTAAGGVFHRPFDSASTGVAGILFPGQTVASAAPFASLKQITSGGISNFNSLNITFKQSVWKGITFNTNYIWAKMMDDGSTPVNNYNSANNTALCTNCVNGMYPDGRSGSGIKMDYGPGAGDTRHTFNGFMTYNLPKFSFVPRLTQGWQVNALYDFYTGGVLNPLIGSDYSFTSESGERPNLVPGQAFYIPKKTTTTATGARVYTTVQAAPFAFPIAGNTTGSFGAYGNLRRDQYRSTGFGDVDFSLFKYTPITEKVKSEFRVEIFNIFNQSNLASPSVSSITSSTFGQITNTKNGAGAPGLGYGEPFNIQFALKILF